MSSKILLILIYMINSFDGFSQIDSPVNKEIRTYYVNEIFSVAAYSNYYELRPLTMPLDNGDTYSFIWETDSTLIIKNSKEHYRIWGVEMEDGLRTLYEVMYGEDKYPNQGSE